MGWEVEREEGLDMDELGGAMNRVRKKGVMREYDRGFAWLVARGLAEGVEEGR